MPITEDMLEADRQLRPESFKPSEDWKAKWSPKPGYITMAETARRLAEGGVAFEDGIATCQCIGETMHRQVEIRPDVWTDPTWVLNVEQNTLGKVGYSDHLDFQVQVFEEDVQAVLHPAPIGEPSRAPSDDLLDHPALPEGWGLRTVGAVAWQAVQSGVGPYGPMRTEVAMAVGDAWSYESLNDWLPL